MTGTLKAIETHYNGYRFRSRTEARWAVFLDTLKVPYLYEPEGFDLDGVRYLPDFYLPQQEYWLEIKPAEPTTEEADRMFALAKASGQRVFCLISAPEKPKWNSEYDDGQARDRHFLHDPEGWDNNYMWCICPFCGFIDLQFEGRSARIRCQCFQNEHPDVYNDRGHTHDDPRLLKAYDAARSARFEFNR